MADIDYIPLEQISLSDLCESSRCHELDKYESYFKSTQELYKRYDWNGSLISAGTPVAPGWSTVAHSERRARTTFQAAKIIVNRLTSFVFGSERFPEIKIEGDPDAEDFAKSLSDVSRLPMRMIEARGLGGAMGTVCLSFGFVDGKPRIEVHNAKHCTVTNWIDKADFKVGSAIKAYKFERPVFENNKIVVKTFYYARYWDGEVEKVWDPIPQKNAEQYGWTNLPHKEFRHPGGVCPFYWVQNLPDSEDLDGYSDYQGLLPEFNEVNQLLSATTKGTIANVDPTLVIREDPAMNEGTVHRGTDNTIWARGGAEYLELKGSSQASADAQLRMLKQDLMDAAQVVNIDPNRLGGAMAASTLKLMYAPMLAKCDVIREQYAEFAIKPILRDMLKTAKAVGTNVDVVEVDGEPVNVAYKLNLPKRMNDAGALEERQPGTSEDVILNWPNYFSPSDVDAKQKVDALKAANGGKSLISHRTSVAAVQSLYGVSDVDAELKAIDEDDEKALEAAKALAMPGPMPELPESEEAETEAPESIPEAEEDEGAE